MSGRELDLNVIDFELMSEVLLVNDGQNPPVVLDLILDSTGFKMTLVLLEPVPRILDLSYPLQVCLVHILLVSDLREVAGPSGVKDIVLV